MATTVECKSFQGVWDSQDPEDDRPNFLTAAVNGYMPDPARGSPFYQRPGVVLHNAGASLGTVGQCIYEHEAWDGTRYVFAFVDGKVYRANSSFSTWTDVSPTNVIIHTGATAPYFITCTSCNDELIVSDGVNKPWRGTSLSSTPITATVIEYTTPSVDLSRGSNDVRLANAAFTYTYRSGASLGQQASFAANAVGTAVGALGQIAANTWGVILVELNTSSGALVFTAAFNAGAGYATEALAIAALPARTVTNWYVGYVTVQADAGAVWIAGTDAFAGGTTGNQAQTTSYYAGEGVPWNTYGPIGIYQGSLIALLSQVATVYARATFTWSEPNEPETGYFQQEFDNNASLTQTDTSPIQALVPTNAGIFYARDVSWGMLIGTLSIDLTNSTTSDAVSENIGAMPWTIDQFGSFIYFADAQGRPWRFALGDAPDDIWQAMRQAAEQNRAQSTPLSKLPTVGWGIVEPNLNVYLYGFPTSDSATGYCPTTFYAFDGQTGRYHGTWQFSGTQAMQTGGIVHNSDGVPVLLMLGTNGGNPRGYVWQLTVPTQNTWQDNGSPISVYGQGSRMGFSVKQEQRVSEVRALCGTDTPCTATMITSNSIITASAQPPMGKVLMSIGSNDTRVATVAFGYIISNVGYSKAAVTAGTAFSAQTVPATKWASYRMSVNTAGTLTLDPAPDNTTGYTTEALAIADVPATPLFGWNVGYLTVQAQNGNPWVAGTDALAGGTTGNEAQTTHYYAGETSFDGTYKITFPLNAITGRGVQVQVAPATTAPASSSASKGQWALFRIEADLVTSTSARDQR